MLVTTGGEGSKRIYIVATIDYIPGNISRFSRNFLQLCLTEYLLQGQGFEHLVKIPGLRGLASDSRPTDSYLYCMSQTQHSHPPMEKMRPKHNPTTRKGEGSAFPCDA
jgi:hypothetical protein